MSTGEFEKTNWSWQLSQFQQQVGEWIELQLSKLESSLPKWSFPQKSINTPWIVDFNQGAGLATTGIMFDLALVAAVAINSTLSVLLYIPSKIS